MSSKIEWTNDTWNPIAGCTKISAGCDNCYAIRQSFRNGQMKQAKYMGTTRKLANGELAWTGKINLDEKSLKKPLTVKKPTMFFVNSMSDLFHESVPFEWVDKVFAIMALCPQHTFQILTKRDMIMRMYFERIEKWTRISEAIKEIAGFHKSLSFTLPLRNVWLGVSVENLEQTNRIINLLNCPAHIHFLSIEPQLENVNIDRGHLRNIDWIIQGGESGPGARPFKAAWAMDMANQCKEAGVAYFFKQYGADKNNPNPDDPTMIKGHPHYAKGGCELNGVVYREMPLIKNP